MSPAAVTTTTRLPTPAQRRITVVCVSVWICGCAQIKEERAETIERDNRILLEKMSQIARTSTGRGHVDNRGGGSGIRHVGPAKRQVTDRRTDTTPVPCAR